MACSYRTDFCRSAYSSVNPDSIEADAPITSHAAAAAIEMDLSRPLKSTIISSQDATGQDSSGSEAEVDEAEGGLVPEKTEQIWTSTDTVVCIHALIGTLAWVVVRSVIYRLRRGNMSNICLQPICYLISSIRSQPAWLGQSPSIPSVRSNRLSDYWLLHSWHHGIK